MATSVKRSVAKKKTPAKKPVPGPKNAARKGKSPIGPVKEGAFHQWLGKKQDEPITQADIQKGLRAGGLAAKRANFARNAKKWHHGKK